MPLSQVSSTRPQVSAGAQATVAVVSRTPATGPVHPPTAGLVIQLAVLTLLSAGVGLGLVGWLAGTAYAVVTWVLLGQALLRPEVRGWGPADTVTLTRATLVGGVTALVADSFQTAVPVVILATLAAVALLLDGVDGQVARRTGTTSSFGARFDMETDAFLVLALSVFVAGSLGWWVLAIGLPRYAFAVAARGLPWLRESLPPRLSRKAVAVLQGVVLVAVSAGVLPTPQAGAALGFVLALLAWSFGRDVGWLWRLRRQDAAVRPDATVS
jgi:phosphatidylglycerophosphate synthase